MMSTHSFSQEDGIFPLWTHAFLLHSLIMSIQSYLIIELAPSLGLENFLVSLSISMQMQREINIDNRYNAYKNSLNTAKIVVFLGETDLYAAFPGTLSSSDKVFCSICEILDNVIRQNIQLRLLC